MLGVTGAIMTICCARESRERACTDPKTLSRGWHGQVLLPVFCGSDHGQEYLPVPLRRKIRRLSVAALQLVLFCMLSAAQWCSAEDAIISIDAQHPRQGPI